MMRGRFVTLEGGEGAGKSTQVALLVAALKHAGIAAIATREPGGSPGAEAVRSLLLEGDSGRWDPIAEALLLFAARRDHLVRLIEPALARGVWVVCDRFADSTVAYQGYGRGLPLADIAALYRLTLGDFVPDLTLVLDLPVETGLARAAARTGSADRFERLDLAFHQRLRRGYRAIAAAAPQRCVLVDGAPDPETVHLDVLAAVALRLEVKLEPAPQPA